MIAREEVLATTESETTATGTVTATAVGTVAWSFAAPTATPPPGISSTAAMDVVPGSGMDAVQRYEYTGRELASESSGYYFFRYRVYGPALGQFFTRDPLGYVDGMGLYAGRFAAGLSRDPLGLADATEHRICGGEEPQAKIPKGGEVGLFINRNPELGKRINELQPKCPLEIKCTCCDNSSCQGATTAGGCTGPRPGGKDVYDIAITICENRNERRAIQATLAHELQHYFDRCNRYRECDPKMPTKEFYTCLCGSHICREMRGFRMEGRCADEASCWGVVVKNGYLTDPQCQFPDGVAITEGEVKAWTEKACDLNVNLPTWDPDEPPPWIKR